MRKYYFIPIALEALLQAHQAAWLAQSPTAYTIVTGVYVPSEYTYNQSEASIKDQADNLIPSHLINEEMGFSELIGFCLEANEVDMPAQLPPEVIIFNNNSEFLEYVNSL